MPQEIATIILLLVILAKRNEQDLAVFLACFNERNIPLALVGYDMIIANSALRSSLAIYHVIYIQFAFVE